MTDPTGRVLPASRQPVTPEDPASPTAAPSADASGTSASPDHDHDHDHLDHDHDHDHDEQDVRVDGTNALNPTTSSVASASAQGEVRTANMDDAQRESVRSSGRDVDFGGGPTGSQEPTYSEATYASPTSDAAGGGVGGSPSYAETYEGTYAGSSYAQPSSQDLMATASAERIGTGGSTVLTRAASPSAKDKATEKAKDLTARGKQAVTKLTAENEFVGKAARGAQENSLVVRAKELTARKSSGGSHAKTVEEPRPPAPELPARTTSPRSAEQIEQDIEKTRVHLAWAVDEVNYRVKPANVMARTKTKAQSQVMQPDGQVRKERVGPAAGVAVGLVLLRVLRSRRRRKKASRRSAQR